MPSAESKFSEIIASVLSASPATAGSVDAAFGMVIRANATRQAAPASAIEALKRWEDARHEALNRYRNWLTHNHILFLADYLNSSQGSSGLNRIKGGFAQNVAEQSLGNLGSLAAVKVGAETGGRVIVKLFLESGTARVLGGIVGFMVGAVVEAVIGDLLDRTSQIVDLTAAEIDNLITGIVNPRVDRQQAEIRQAMQDLRDELANNSPSADRWIEIKDGAIAATAQIEAVFVDQRDERLYREMALLADVYSKPSVHAEEEPVVTLTGLEHDLRFTMQHVEVKTGETSIDVLHDGGTIVVRFRAYDCVQDDDGFGEVDIASPDAPPSWKMIPPPREYEVRLYQPGTVSDSVFGVPRVFDVGKEEYGVWYNLAKGVYHLMVNRGDDHPVALCGEGKYWVKADQL